MSNSTPAPTPVTTKPLTYFMSPVTAEQQLQMQDVPFRSAVGALMHLMVCTRPDIAHAVISVSQFMANQGQEHWTVLKRILCYLRATPNHGLLFNGNNSQRTALTGFVDADYAGDVDQRRSRTGFCFRLQGGVIDWSSKKQTAVALSSCEAEYMAICAAAKEAIWLRRLLEDLGYQQEQPTTLFNDNASAIRVAKDPACFSRTKHIEVQFHFTREKVEERKISLSYLNTRAMIADVLTKPLPAAQFQICIDRMGVRSGFE